MGGMILEEFPAPFPLTCGTTWHDLRQTLSQHSDATRDIGVAAQRHGTGPARVGAWCGNSVIFATGNGGEPPNTLHQCLLGMEICESHFGGYQDFDPSLLNDEKF